MFDRCFKGAKLTLKRMTSGRKDIDLYQVGEGTSRRQLLKNSEYLSLFIEV